MPILADVAQLALDLGKATFDNAAASLGTLQAMGEDRVLDAVRDIAWIPGPVKSIVGEWIGLARRTRQDLTATVDKTYVLLCELTGSGVPRPTTPASSRVAPAAREAARQAPSPVIN